MNQLRVLLDGAQMNNIQEFKMNQNSHKKSKTQKNRTSHKNAIRKLINQKKLPKSGSAMFLP
jgi:hypothetical protein